MSTSNVLGFIAKVEHDALLKEYVGKTNSLDEIVRIANDAGHGFTLNDWQASIPQVKCPSELRRVEGS